MDCQVNSTFLKFDVSLRMILGYDKYKENKFNIVCWVLDRIDASIYKNSILIHNHAFAKV